MESTLDIGRQVKRQRKQLGMNQAELAMVSGTGVRFISDLENGKETCEVGKVLKVLASLGLKIAFHGDGEGRE
jgi:HTH-type transcriptional regulator/antitoxin HipB